MTPFHSIRLAAVTLSCCVGGCPAQAQAQSDYLREDGVALVVSVQGGQYGPLTHLDDDSWVEFKTGMNVGGGFAYRLNRHVALRAHFTFVRAEVRDDRSSFTKPAARIGGGLSYGLPRTDLSLFIQGAGWIYKWDRYGFDSLQFDTTLSGGFSYRLGL